MQLLRRFLALTPDERRVLVSATFWVAVVKLGLGRIPFATLRRLVTIGRRNVARSAGDRVIPDQVAWAVTLVSRHVPGPTTCLSRALTVQGMLARLGYPSRLHVGVLRGKQGQVEGHAWVECEGRILIGGTPSEIGQFSPLAVFDVQAPAFRLQAAETLQGSR
jgi:hypothetical protein